MAKLGYSMAKVRASSIEERVRKALRAAGVAKTEIESNLTNGMPLNSWFFPVGNASDWEAGWQVQNGQFRLAIRVMTKESGFWGPSEEKIKKRENFAKDHEELFDFSYLDKLLGTVGSATQPNNKQFLRYNPNFVYRYKKVPRLTVSQLEEAAVAVARRLMS